MRCQCLCLRLVANDANCQSNTASVHDYKVAGNFRATDTIERLVVWPQRPITSIPTTLSSGYSATDTMLSRVFCCTVLLLSALLLSSAPVARATALTTAIAANERLCFYADVDKAGEKLGVCLALAYHVWTLFNLPLLIVLLCRMSSRRAKVSYHP
jgi:hypothetical protein